MSEASYGRICTASLHDVFNMQNSAVHMYVRLNYMKLPMVGHCDIQK